MVIHEMNRSGNKKLNPIAIINYILITKEHNSAVIKTPWPFNVYLKIKRKTKANARKG